MAAANEAMQTTTIKSSKYFMLNFCDLLSLCDLNMNCQKISNYERLYKSFFAIFILFNLTQKKHLWTTVDIIFLTLNDVCTTLVKRNDFVANLQRRIIFCKQSKILDRLARVYARIQQKNHNLDRTVIVATQRRRQRIFFELFSNSPG